MLAIFVGYGQNKGLWKTNSAILKISSDLVEISSDLVQISSELVRISSELVTTSLKLMIISTFIKQTRRDSRTLIFTLRRTILELIYSQKLFF